MIRAFPRASRASLALAGTALLFACRASAPAAESFPDPSSVATPWKDAAGHVSDPELAGVCTDAWEESLAADPVQATYLGDTRRLHELPPPSPLQHDLVRAHLADLVRRAQAIEPARLDASDRLTWTLLLERWRIALDDLDDPIDPDSWNLNPRGGPQVDFLTLAADQPARTAQECAQLLARWKKIPAYVEQCAANLRRGLAQGRTASHTSTARVLEQVEHLLATEPEESPLVAQIRWGNKELERDYRERVLAAVKEEIYPAFRVYRDVLAEVLPHARDDDHPGIGQLPGGSRTYRRAIVRETSLALSPEDVHEIGLAEVARLRAEIAKLGQSVFGTSDVSEIQRRLREDPELHFKTADEIEAKARDTLARAQAAVPAMFGRLPDTPCDVVRVPDHEAPDTTVAYYREPAPDGSRPGRYYVNTYAPETRTRYEAEALAFHESVPGHHLQIAIAQKLEGLPLVRRHQGSTAFVEGWALYTERLCDERGLYSSDLDRLGMLSFAAWRACRLVVDTGIHALGWTRQQAIDYMVANTLLAQNNVENEVDRYIAWPGQALAYEIGRREIFALRASAQEQLGERFSLSEFHDRVLENGAVTLSVLRERIAAWVRQKSSNAP